MNRVILIGNLGEDPKFHPGDRGGIIRLSVATTERFKNRDGVWTERTEWHRVVMFGGEAESLSRSLRKGQRLMVEGSIKYSTYKDDKGVERPSVEIVAREIDAPVFKDMADRSDGSSQGYGARR